MMTNAQAALLAAVHERTDMHLRRDEIAQTPVEKRVRYFKALLDEIDEEDVNARP